MRKLMWTLAALAAFVGTTVSLTSSSARAQSTVAAPAAAPVTAPASRQVVAPSRALIGLAPSVALAPTAAAAPSALARHEAALEAMDEAIASTTMFCDEQAKDCPGGFRCELGACVAE